MSDENTDKTFADIHEELLEMMGKGESDELLAAAAEVLRKTKDDPIHSLMEQLAVGYNCASRIIDTLTEQGVFTPPPETAGS